jgi:hypothetical protein
LSLLHDLRFERARPIAWNLDLDLAGVLRQHRLRPGAVADVACPGAGRVVLLITQVLGHLLVQRGLQHRFRQLLEQPVRARQRQSLLPGHADQLNRSLPLCRLFVGLLLRHAIQCRRHQTPTLPAE